MIGVPPSDDTAPHGGDELVPLPGGPFRLWPVGVVRGAGFPLADLVRLGDPDFAGTADRLLDGPAAADVHGLARSADLRARWAAARRREGELLVEVAARPDFQTAVAWQNHAVLRPMVQGLVERGPGHRPNQWLRRRERLVAKYWARYCAKNDTIGSFGPACWFRLDTGDEAVTAVPGPGLTERAEVFLEGWAVDALAEALAGDPGMRPWLPVRINPMVHFDGAVVHTYQGAVPLDPAKAAVLAGCDGERTGVEIAAALVADPGTPFTDPAEVMAVLDGFAGHMLVFRSFEPPLQPRPELVLRRRLERIGEPGLRERALGLLGELEAGRDQVAAAGTVAELDKALADLADRFVRATGQAPTHHPGRTYGARQLSYFDTRRALDMSVGAGFLATLGPPLSALLHGTRRLTRQLAEAHASVFERAYDTLAARGNRTVPLVDLLVASDPQLNGPGPRVLDRVVAGHVEQWGRLLGLDSADRLVRLTADELWARVRAEFGDARPGWPQARHHGVDVQIAARSGAAIGRGEFELVLGELHPAWCTLESAALVGSYDRPERLAALSGAGLPGGRRITLVPAKDYPRATVRTVSALDTGRDWWLAPREYPGGPPGRRLSFAGLVVERVDGRLVVSSRDGRARFDLAEVSGVWHTFELMDAFKLLTAGRPHTPRVVVDRLVLCRETWRFDLADLPFGGIADELAGFLAARRWAGEHRLPRFVFAKLSSEMKPCYVDLASPVLVGVLAGAVRRGLQEQGAQASMTVSEMLPAPEQAWLPDAAGHRYTSELRLQVVDPAGPGSR